MPIPTRALITGVSALSLVLAASPLAAQNATQSTAQNAATAPDGESRAALAVADSVLRALSSGDRAMLKRQLLDSAIVGTVSMRSGAERVAVSTWTRYTAGTGPAEFTERGFGATARVQDRVAHVWVPYDLYVGKTWSHWGVDVFTMLKSDGRWRVASLIYTIEQPPACQKHPAGPPPG